MEVLAYTHLYMAQEEAALDPDAYELKSFKGFNWKPPSSAWIRLLSAIMALSILTIANSSFAIPWPPVPRPSGVGQVIRKVGSGAGKLVEEGGSTFKNSLKQVKPIAQKAADKLISKPLRFGRKARVKTKYGSGVKIRDQNLNVLPGGIEEGHQITLTGNRFRDMRGQEWCEVVTNHRRGLVARKYLIDRGGVHSNSTQKPSHFEIARLGLG